MPENSIGIHLPSYAGISPSLIVQASFVFHRYSTGIIFSGMYYKPFDRAFAANFPKSVADKPEEGAVSKAPNKKESEPIMGSDFFNAWMRRP